MSAMKALAIALDEMGIDPEFATNEEIEAALNEMEVIRYGVCTSCKSADNIVHSGIDAFLLNVAVGYSCYTCANGGYEHAEEAM